MMVTAAVGTTAPVGSVTVPVSTAFSWDHAPTQARIRNNGNRKNLCFAFFI